ncbi:MAG: hypothetical protein ABFC34_11490 [Methanobacterium sp.]
MINTKEIKSVKLASFTKMTASIYGVLGFIAALVMLITLIIMQAVGVIPQLAPQLGQFNFVTGLGIPLLVLLPIGAFFITIVVSLFSVMLYNALVPRLGGIRLELEGEDVVKIPVIPFSLILSAIGAIWAFIIGLLTAALIAPLFSVISTPSMAANITDNLTNTTGATVISISSITTNITTNLTNTTGTTIPDGTFGTAGIILALLLVIGLPILAFVFGFIWNALFALFYNYLVTRVAKIKLEFSNITGSLHELKHIPVIPTALAVALVFTLLGIISGILDGNYGEFITNFVFYFIEIALIALLYNYLAPKIGSIKINMG